MIEIRESFSADAELYFSRTRAQIDIRFDKKQRNTNNVVRDDQDMILAMFVDPRVKRLLKSSKAIASLKATPINAACL